MKRALVSLAILGMAGILATFVAAQQVLAAEHLEGLSPSAKARAFIREGGVGA